MFLLRISILTCFVMFSVSAHSKAASSPFAAFNSLLPQENASSQENSVGKPIEILGKVVVHPKPQGAAIFPDHQIDLGEIECGKRYLLKIRLINESKEVLSFRRVGASCSCVELRVPKGDIPVGESLDVEAIVSVPEKQDAQVFLTSIDFFSDKNGRDESPFLRVRAISKKVRGLICFGAVPSVFQVGKSLRRLEIPLIVTDPIDPKKLEIEASETLSDAVLAITAEEGAQDELVIDIAGIVLDEGFLDCWVKIRDPHTERMAKANFMIEKTPAASVSPKIISFSKDGDKGYWQTKAFMLLDLSVTQNDDGKGQPPTSSDDLPSVKAIIAENTLEVKCSNVRPGLYRLEMSVPKSLLPDSDEGEVRWCVEFGSFQSDFKSLWRKF